MDAFLSKFPSRLKLHSALATILMLLLTAGLLGACGRTYAKRLPTATPLPTPTRIPTFTPMPLPTVTPLPSAGCAQPNLLPGLHISASGSYTQTQTEAVGPPRCRIQRNSCAYYQLVGNLDASLIFQGEEGPPYDGEDILMHPAMLLPLSRLNELVRAEWNDAYQLRVTDAYDSLLEHDLNQPDQGRRASLHFEGRAIDLTLWPRDLSQYGRLCALAHCAGFGWVHHEGDHCHAAINAESLCDRC